LWTRSAASSGSTAGSTTGSTAGSDSSGGALSPQAQVAQALVGMHEGGACGFRMIQRPCMVSTGRHSRGQPVHGEHRAALAR
jgi:hypothetical protein